MHGCRILAAVLILVSVALNPPPVDAAGPWPVCGSSGQYTAGSAYQANLQRVTDTLPTNTSTSPTLFATATIGAGTNQTVYALALCQGDLAPSACLACVDSAFRDGQLVCAFDMDMAVYKDSCHVRFSDQDFLAASTSNSQQHAFFSNAPNLSSSAAGRFNSVVAVLLNATADYAVSVSKTRFATGVMEVDPDYSDGQFADIYSTAQCTPDLTRAQCRACLVAAMEEMPRLVFPSNSPGAIVSGERCGLRFDTFSFFNGDAMVQLHAGGPQGKRRSSKRAVVLAAALSVGALLVLLFVLICLYMQRRRMRGRNKTHRDDARGEEGSRYAFPEQFTLPLLRAATGNFAAENKLGEGGFGQVFKGILPDGQAIAVKRLSQSSSQGFHELKNELLLASKLLHRNLVRLHGVCLEEREKLVVYEYLPNRSLDTILFDNGRRRRRHGLDWRKRYTIICGIARGLLYLHEESQLRVIHRDLKPSNVLLDENMNPKISDFGLARAFRGDQSRDITKRAAGTLGYMSPEYAYSGHVSTKSDMYSFGVIVLEIVTGRRNTSPCQDANTSNLLSDVWEKWRAGKAAEIADASLGEHYPRSEMLSCVHIGLLCVQKKPALRPDASEVMLMLNSQSTSRRTPSRPAFYSGPSTSSDASLVSSGNVSQNGVTMSELQPR